VSPIAFAICLAWLALTAVVAAVNARRGLREGRGARALGRLKSPTIYLFTAYLVIAAWVTPMSQGESTSPLFWLAMALPVAYALATLSSIGAETPAPATRAALALLHGGAMLAAAALILALASPAFVPSWLR